MPKSRKIESKKSQISKQLRKEVRKLAKKHTAHSTPAKKKGKVKGYKSAKRITGPKKTKFTTIVPSKVTQNACKNTAHPIESKWTNEKNKKQRRRTNEQTGN